MSKREEVVGWLFISPWVFGFFLFVLGPMIVSLVLSLTKWSAMAPLSDAEFVGFDNYRYLFFYDKTIGKSAWVTIYYTILAVPIGQVAALGIALLMNVSIRGISFLRTMFFVPSVVTGVALTTLWIWLFNSESGLINGALEFVVNEAPDWFGKDSRIYAVPAIVVMSLWGVGGGMVIYIAGLKCIPQYLYEAARIDGAGAIRQFFIITLPMLSPLIYFTLIMGIIGSFQVFTQAFVITSTPGGQNEDLLFYVLNLYNQAFLYHHVGYASAMAWVLFVALLLFTLLIIRSSKAWVYYEGLRA